jgi:hypothetical protein
VTDSTQASRPVGARPRPFAAVLALGGRFLVISISALLMVGGAIGGYLLGRDMAKRPLADATELIGRLQPENQRLKQTTLSQTTEIATLRSQLVAAQTTLHGLLPSENTYNINANQSLIVAGGHLTVGLIGPPSNREITISINGKQYSAVTGDIFNIAPDPATACEVRVQSFDMFSAAVNALCSAKPQ